MRGPRSKVKYWCYNIYICHFYGKSGHLRHQQEAYWPNFRAETAELRGGTGVASAGRWRGFPAGKAGSHKRYSGIRQGGKKSKATGSESHQGGGEKTKQKNLSREDSADLVQSVSCFPDGREDFEVSKTRRA